MLIVALTECKPTEAGKTDAGERRIGVLLVNNSSRSATSRNELLRLEENVRPGIMAQSGFVALTAAFMEYTEPSIATRPKEFDARGITDLIMVPVFLTVSSHSFDDIPTITGHHCSETTCKIYFYFSVEFFFYRSSYSSLPLA